MRACLVCAVAVWFSASAVLGQEGGSAVATENGDVNGDGGIDLSDAVFTLVHLFGNGPAPVAIQDPPALVQRIAQLEEENQRLMSESIELWIQLDKHRSRMWEWESRAEHCEEQLNNILEWEPKYLVCKEQLDICMVSEIMPATGQEYCYSSVGDVVDCDSPSWPGQDPVFAKGCPRDSRFLYNGEDTIVDSCTGLTWQRYVTCAGTEFGFEMDCRANWEAALIYCNTLNSQTSEGWRLPNINELRSLLDPASELSLPGTMAPREIDWPGKYWETQIELWSSTTAPLAGDKAYSLNMTTGEMKMADKASTKIYMRAVYGP